MKKMIRRITVVALILGLNTVQAHNVSDQLKTLNILKENKGQKVVIRNIEGTVIHSELLDDNNNFNFNLASLKDGLYLLEYDRGFEIKIESVAVRSNKVFYLENTETIIFKPVVRIENGKVLISKIAFGDEPVKVKLYFEGELILSEELKDSSVVNRVYRLKENIEGEYRLSIISNNRVYTENFTN